MMSRIRSVVKVHRNAREKPLTSPKPYKKISLCWWLIRVDIDLFRTISVKSSTMHFELTNRKTRESSAKASFACLVKGLFPCSIDNDLVWIVARRTHADYYSIIKQPIDFIRIQQKVRTEEYQTLEQFTDDIQLLFTNAKTFYRVRNNSAAIRWISAFSFQKNSNEWRDANDLLKYYHLKKQEFTDENPQRRTSRRVRTYTRAREIDDRGRSFSLRIKMLIMTTHPNWTENDDRIDNLRKLRPTEAQSKLNRKIPTLNHQPPPLTLTISKNSSLRSTMPVSKSVPCQRSSITCLHERYGSLRFTIRVEDRLIFGLVCIAAVSRLLSGCHTTDRLEDDCDENPPETVSEPGRHGKWSSSDDCQCKKIQRSEITDLQSRTPNGKSGNADLVSCLGCVCLEKDDHERAKRTGLRPENRETVQWTTQVEQENTRV